MHRLPAELYGCDRPALEASYFYIPRNRSRMLETFASFIKLSIILWIATHLLCVYRNMQHLSKTNSRRSEDSAETLLLSVSNTLLVALGSPASLEMLPVCQSKLFFQYGSETHNFFFCCCCFLFLL